MNSEPRRIRPLPPALANQIAAGEVVERPASVVKELVENSLDAGADEIAIEVEEGGVRLLRVRDNGHGIHRDDLALALSRHATSKIHSARDLHGILSLGFRGEALASIASVARVRLMSRTRDAESGWSVAGEAESPSPAPHPVGTTVEMRDLFFNLPARRKFLRAERTEYEHVEEMVRRLALGNFATAFSLRHNGRQVFNVPVAADTPARERRVGTLVGRPFVDHAAAIDFAAAGLRLHGWIGARGYTRSQADLQYLFLNGRTVRDRVVNHALRQGFESAITEGRFPAYLLYLEMDPAQVDVNVHPTKHEVRFREARLVHDFLVSALRSALGEAQQWSAPAPPPPRTEAVAERRDDYAAFQRLAEVPAASAHAARVLSLIGGRFLVAEGAQGLVIADLRQLLQQEARAALQQRVLAGEMASRPLLIPPTVRVGSDGVQRAEAGAGDWQRVGLQIEAVSADAVRVLGVPAVEYAFDATALVHAVLPCGDADDLIDAVAQAVVVPTEPRAWPALLARAQTQGWVKELNAEELARWVQTR